MGIEEQTQKGGRVKSIDGNDSVAIWHLSDDGSVQLSHIRQELEVRNWLLGVDTW